MLAPYGAATSCRATSSDSEWHRWEKHKNICLWALPLIITRWGCKHKSFNLIPKQNGWHLIRISSCGAGMRAPCLCWLLLLTSKTWLGVIKIPCPEEKMTEKFMQRERLHNAKASGNQGESDFWDYSYITPEGRLRRHAKPKYLYTKLIAV